MGKTAKIAVLGAGSFGSAMAYLLGQNGRQVRLWMRNPATAAECGRTRINHAYMAHVQMPDSVLFTSDLETAVDSADLILFTLPSKAFRSIAKQLAPVHKAEVPVISGTKGVEPGTSSFMAQILREELGESARIGVISGPNLAKEISEDQITGSVIASEDQDLCELVQELFGCGNFRVYSNPDVVGVELAGTLKNIYAIFAGVASGAGAGGNTFGMLITRSLAEMRRFSVAQGAQSETFLGLSGVGDLITTCTSPLSRNYKVGVALAQGMSLDEAVRHVGQTAEGVNTVKVICEQAKRLNVSMPLAEGMYQILYENENWQSVVGELMQREQRQESE